MAMHVLGLVHMGSGRKRARSGLGGVVRKFRCQERIRLGSPVVTSSKLGSLSISDQSGYGRGIIFFF